MTGEGWSLLAVDVSTESSGRIKYTTVSYTRRPVVKMSPSTSRDYDSGGLVTFSECPDTLIMDFSLNGNEVD